MPYQKLPIGGAHCDMLSWAHHEFSFEEQGLIGPCSRLRPIGGAVRQVTRHGVGTANDIVALTGATPRAGADLDRRIRNIAPLLTPLCTGPSATGLQSAR